MKWRKLMTATLASALALSLVAGCSGTKKDTSTGTTPAPAADKPVTLEFWGWWSSATRMPTINKIVDGWNKDHPNIQVKYTFVPYGDLMTKYLASVAAGNPPDVVVSPDIFTVAQRAQKKQAMDLTSLGADSIKDQFFPQFWNMTNYQGKAYGIPWTGETKYLYYNKDMFQAAGLDPEKGPVTWDDLWNDAAKLDKKDGNKYSVMAFHPLFGNFDYRGWVWNASSTFFDDRQFPTINTDKNIQVMDWVKKWTDRYGYDQYAAFKGANGGGPQNLFVQKKLAMVVDTATWEGELKKNGPDIHYGIVPIPTPDGKQHQNASYSGGFDVEIPVGAKNPKQSFEFAKYWATDAAVVWAQEQNDFPAYNKAVEKITTPEFKRMVDNMKNTGLIPLPQFAPLWNDPVTVAIQDVISGKKDSKTALGEAQSAVAKMVSDNMNK